MIDSISNSLNPLSHLPSIQLLHLLSKSSMGVVVALSSSVIPIIVTSIVLISVLILALLILLIYRRANNNKLKENSNDGFSDIEKQVSKCSIIVDTDVKNCFYDGKLVYAPQAKCRAPQVFTYRELELATDGFSDGNLIGNGALAVVFRGRLSDGTIVAIKMLRRDRKHGERDFRIEVDLMSRLHSPHLVGLVGYCADQHHRVLVLEFMPNGSLHRHLNPSSDDRHPPLEWRARIQIALDCARGLEFLHEYTSPAVIHRDLKCSNILLDHNLRAKLSDFGSAKTGSDKIDGRIKARVMGTTGYVAPEYASTGKLTIKSDVYSYGVVLLQLLTGRVPVDITRPPGEHVLVSWALPRLTNRDKVAEMVDPALNGQYSKKELIQIAAIAAVCVQPEADYRPLITDVVQSLIPLVKGPAGSCPSTPSRSQHHARIPSMRMPFHVPNTCSNGCA